MTAASSGAGDRHQFPCSNCGALQTYLPGSTVLQCPYCNHQTPIPEIFTEITEHDFHSALRKLAEARRSAPSGPGSQAITISCDACGSQFQFEQDIHSGECPYCGHSVVLGTSEEKLFKPQSLLAFKIEETAAKERFRRWLRSLWLAPSGLKQYAKDDSRLNGIYLPYWTYDSDTTTQYVGERGDTYQVPEEYVTIQDGRRVVRRRMVTKIRWTSVRGVVSRFFDDVLIGASRSLPRQITDRLAPWDLENLGPFQKEYLSGFGSQAYQVELDRGFEYARNVMDGIIRADIARDIGGDAQRIHRLETRHRHTTFKHILLPIWSAEFSYRNKSYHFVVNARTGKVQGERPYSKWKIALVVGIGMLLLIAAIFVFQNYQQSAAGGTIEIFPRHLGNVFR